MLTDRPPIVQHSNAKQLPTILLALEYQLEQVRLQQLAKNRSMLQSLTCDEQQHVEHVTAAITQKIFREISTGLQCSATNRDGKRLSEIISLMFGLG